MIRANSFRFGQISINTLAYASQATGILGIRDSGKTYTATKLAELLHISGIPFIAFDPVGVWRFLRVPGDGRGLPVVVAGGIEGDLALTHATAPAIVEAAMKAGISLVIDLFSMDLSKADWRRIVRDSVRLLLHKNRPHGLRHVFLEEAAEFVPQIVRDGDVYAEVEKLGRMGGNAGLGLTLINQRAEEVNKAVLELCDNLFLHRQKGRNSLTALGKWLDIGNVDKVLRTEIMASLSTLPTGECWAWLESSSVPVRVKVPKKASLHPDRRTLRGEHGAVAEARVDVGDFVASLQQLLPAIAQEAAENDPKRLRAEIKRLQGAVTAAAPDAESLARAREQGRREGRAEGESDVSGLRQAVSELQAALAEIAALATRHAAPMAAHERPGKTGADVSHSSVGSGRRRPGVAPTNGASPNPTPVRQATPPGLPTSARKLMDVLEKRAPVWLTWTQTATLAGLAPRGGSFNTAKKRLKESAHLIEEEGDKIRARRAADGRDGAPDTPAQVLSMWVGRLPTSASRLLAGVAEWGPIAPAELADRLGVAARGGSWNTAMAILRNNELVTTEDGRMRLVDVLAGE